MKVLLVLVVACKRRCRHRGQQAITIRRLRGCADQACLMIRAAAILRRR